MHNTTPVELWMRLRNPDLLRRAMQQASQHAHNIRARLTPVAHHACSLHAQLYGEVRKLACSVRLLSWRTAYLASSLSLTLVRNRLRRLSSQLVRPRR